MAEVSLIQESRALETIAESVSAYTVLRLEGCVSTQKYGRRLHVPAMGNSVRPEEVCQAHASASRTFSLPRSHVFLPDSF